MTEKELRVAFNSYIRDYGKMIGRSTRDMRQTILLHFTQGVNASDKHWQEKTRWIPIEERLPAFEGKRRTVLVKTGDDLYSFLWIIQEVSLSDFECQDYTHWKEIE